MNKTELINAIAEKTGLAKSRAGDALDGVMGAIGNALQKGDKVTIPGFGTFEVSSRAARAGRNPRTGEEIEISASKNVKFKAGKALKDKVK